MNPSNKHEDESDSAVSLEIEAANNDHPLIEPKSGVQRRKTMIISKIKKICIFIPAVVLISCCAAITSLLTSVILLVSLLVTRILQLVGHGDDYAKLVRFKHLIRLGLCLNAALFLIELGIFYPFAKHVPCLQQLAIYELPLSNWITLGCIIFSMHLLSFSIYVPIHGIIAKLMNQFSLNVGQSISEIIDGGIIWWATMEVIKHFPSIKHHQILGLSAQQWMKVSILVLFGYNLIVILTHVLVLLLSMLSLKLQIGNLQETGKNEVVRKLVGYGNRLPYLVYCAKWMTLSIIFLLSSLLLLLTWILYFGSHLDMSLDSVRSLWEYGKWTFVCLFVFSLLWLIKCGVTLVWDNHAFNENLWQQVFDISRELYFFGWLDSQQDGVEDGDENKDCVGRYIGSVSLLVSLLNFAQLYKMANTRDTFMSHLKKVARLRFMYVDLQQITLFLFEAKTYLFREELSNSLGFYDDNSFRARNNVSKILENFKSKSSQSPNEHLVDYLCIKLAKLVEEYSDDYACSQFIKWREETYNQCSNLENIIRSAKEVGYCFERIMDWLLIGVIFIVWLLLTGLASTKVLVIIASPLLAATFIFGETCKTLFEGIIFVFVVHPFRIGDTCQVDNEKLEVRSIGVWTTIFTKLDESGQRLQEVVTYPNKELNSKVIINYKAEFNWSDELEFGLLSEIINYYLDHESLKDELISKLKKYELPIQLNSLEMKIKCVEGSWILHMSLQYKTPGTTISSSNMTMTSYESSWLKKKLRRAFEDIVQQIIKDLTPGK